MLLQVGSAGDSTAGICDVKPFDVGSCGCGCSITVMMRVSSSSFTSCLKCSVVSMVRVGVSVLRGVTFHAECWGWFIFASAGGVGGRVVRIADARGFSYFSTDISC